MSTGSPYTDPPNPAPPAGPGPSGPYQQPLEKELPAMEQPYEESEGELYAMGDSEFLGTIQTEIDSALGWTGTRLAESRRKSLDAYFSNGRGDERPGRSTVVTRDVFEQVEWVNPQIIEMFMASDKVAIFSPRVANRETADEDQRQADQATDTVNYVFRRNGGFNILDTMFRDAFIQKNGIVKVWWEDSVEACPETYHGKDFFSFMKLQEDKTFEIRAVTTWMEDENGERFDVELEEIPPMELQNVWFDVEGVRKNAAGRVQIDNVPPEEFIINRDARSLYDTTCRFVGHRIRCTESDLIRWGYDPELAKSVPGAQSVYTTDQDLIVRASQDDSYPLTYSNRNDSERTIYVTECYIQADRDGDGISEWWRAVVGGDYGQTLLDAEPCDGHPFASVTPIRIPHRFYGLGFGDITDDLQEINTTLWRQYLDCQYLQTDPRNVVLSQGQGENAVPMVNLDQLVNAEPGGYIEEYAPNALRPYEQTSNAQDLIPAMELHKSMREARTGVSPESMGVNPEAISKHVYGAMVQQSAAQMRIAYYARAFAETGVKELFHLIYKCLLRNQSKPMVIKLRGEWAEVDPSSWSHGMDCTIAVGLGHGSRMEKASNAQAVLEMQKQLHEYGAGYMAPPKQIYNALAAGAEALGFKNTEQFFVDPEENPPPPPEPSPEEKAIEAQQQLELMKVELDRQKLEIERDKIALDAKKAELDHEVEIQKLRAQGYAAEMDDAFTMPLPPPARPVTGPPGGGSGAGGGATR